MVRGWILVVHTPGIPVYRVGKWHPILSWIKKVISPKVFKPRPKLSLGMPYGIYLNLLLARNVWIGYGITVHICYLGFDTDLVWNVPPCGSQ